MVVIAVACCFSTRHQASCWPAAATHQPDPWRPSRVSRRRASEQGVAMADDVRVTSSATQQQRVPISCRGGANGAVAVHHQSDNTVRGRQLTPLLQSWHHWGCCSACVCARAQIQTDTARLDGSEGMACAARGSALRLQCVDSWARRRVVCAVLGCTCRSAGVGAIGDVQRPHHSVLRHCWLSPRR